MMRPTLMPWVVLIAVLSMAMTSARAETPDEWIALGARVHGGFGSFIPLGIRIGLDALQRLDAKPRDVTVVYYDNDKAPCACVADEWQSRRWPAWGNGRSRSQQRRLLLI